jgi:enamine deaminase RidA (YjgF/YER057c/UK114 family)
MDYDARMTEMHLSLPPAAAPVGAYVPTVQTDKLVFVSGQLPVKEGKLLSAGKVGEDVDLAQAQEAARIAVVNGLAAIKAELGSLNRIARVVRLEVYVNSAPGFTDQAQVANAASNLLQELFGDIGRHTRIALGMAELPLNASVELGLIVEIR